MDATLTVVFNIAVQLLVAAAAAAASAAIRRRSRRQRLRQLDTWRAMRRAVPLAAIIVTLAALVDRAGVARIVWEPVPMLVPGLATLCGAWGTGGMLLTLTAGAAERRGRLARARRQVGRGGRAAFLGAAVQVVLWGVAFFAQTGERQRALVAAGALAGQAAFGAMLLGTGGFVALLAALTGKPRPSGAAAALLYLAGYGLLVAAALALVN